MSLQERANRGPSLTDTLSGFGPKEVAATAIAEATLFTVDKLIFPIDINAYKVAAIPGMLGVTIFALKHIILLTEKAINQIENSLLALRTKIRPASAQIDLSNSPSVPVAYVTGPSID